MSNIAVKDDPDSLQSLPPLKGKQRLWLRNYTNINNPKTFFNATESAKCSNYQGKDDNSFATIGKINYRKLQGYIDKWLNEHGLSDIALKGRLCSLMSAKDVRLFTKRDEDGKLEIIEHEVPALGIQQKSLDMAFKIKGLYQDSGQGNVPTFNINFVGVYGPAPAISGDLPGPGASHREIIDLSDDDFSEILADPVDSDDDEDFSDI